MSPADPDEDIRVRGHVIPASELHWRFEPSGGPGGQHANRSSTRAILEFDLSSSASFDQSAREDILARLGSRAKDGRIRIAVDETRSQWRNRALARRRLAEMLEEALRPRRKRKRTKPTKASRERRLRAKRRKAEKKRLRRPPEDR